MSEEEVEDEDLRAIARPRRLPWLMGLAGLVGVILHVLGFLALVQRESPLAESEPVPRRVGSPISLLDADDQRLAALLAERSELFDSAPLFFSRPENFGYRARRAAAETFSSEPLFDRFEPELSAPESLDALASAAQTPPVEPRATFDPRLYAFFDDLGSAPQPQAALPERLAEIEIYAFDQQRSDTRPLRADDLPAAVAEALQAASRERSWTPVQLLALSSPVGGLGQPRLLGSTGNEALDDALRDWSATPAFTRRFIPDPGYYRITLGP